MDRRTVFATLVLLAATGAAVAQTGRGTPPPLRNAGFEIDPINTFPNDQNGWAVPGFDPEAVWRQNEDGLSPTVTCRTGTGCVEIKAAATGGAWFRGWTTDTQYFLPPTFVQARFFDVNYDYNGGDIVFSGWYMIPTDQPIDLLSPAGVKLNLKGCGSGNQDCATLETWGDTGPGDEPPRITGTTNGQWRQYTFTWRAADFRQAFQNNVGNSGINPTPQPDRIKITIGRFYPGPNTEPGGQIPPSGTIFWDDISIGQAPVGPVACNVADIVSIGGFPPADGELTVDDYTSFINAFAGDEILADIVSIGGFPPPDGELTVDDYTSFINAFAEGCAG